MSFPIATALLEQLTEGLYWNTAAIDGAHFKHLSDLELAIPDPGPRSVESRYQEFYAGRWCAAQGQHSLCGEWHIPVIGEGRAPVWQQGIVGSISHTRLWAASAVGHAARFRAIGIDLESLACLPTEVSWLQEIADTRELDLVSGLASSAAPGLIFSAKESLFKALYPLTNVYFEFRDARVISASPDALELQLGLDLDSVFSKNQRFQARYLAQNGHVLTSVVLVH